jgi:benzoate/toluate 1,2-dioxygenase alpha subunit
MADDVWGSNALGLEGSRVIDRNIYVDPTVLAAEQDRLFAKTWQWVAHDTEIPEFGDYVTATIAGRPIIVSRGDDDKITAFFNTCTHRGALLAVRARGNSGGSFTCLYHAWCFDTEGKLTSAPLPAAYGERLRKACYDVPTIRLETFAGNIFVSLDPDVEPLEDFLGETKPYIEMFTGKHEAIGRVRWMLEGNWKLWHENFRDNYHPMYAHMMIGVNYQGVEILGRNYALSRGHSLMAFPPQGNPAALGPVIRKLTGKDAGAVTIRKTEAPADAVGDNRNMIMAVFPNLDFQHSAVQDHNLLQIVRPVATDKAIVEIVVFGEKGEPAEVRQARLETTLDGQTAAGKISGDDTEAVRRCATGFATVKEVRWSNMDRGQEPGLEGNKNDEYSLRAFYVSYKQYMGDSLYDLG